jgi:nucleotide-binding universal stress UspA family protein
MYNTILLPIDISDEESCAPAFASVLNLAKAFGSSIHVMTVVPDYGMSMVQQYFPKGWLEEIINKATADLHRIAKHHVPEGIDVKFIIGRGAVYECIIDTAERVKADLIVMSSNRPELKDYLLGPNAAKVVRHSKISVLVVRDPK